MDLYNLLVSSKKGNELSKYNIIKDFERTIKKLSRQLKYEEAETDLIIELIKLINRINLENFKDASQQQIASYIHIHLKNRTCNLARKNKEKYLLESDNIEMQYSVKLQSFEDNIVLLMLIDLLSEKQKQVITLEFIYGYSEMDISNILHISRQAVNKTKNRALVELKKLYRDDGNKIDC